MHDGKRLPDVLMVMTGFSMTHMSWPGNGQTEQTESLFAGWDIPAPVSYTHLGSTEKEIQELVGNDPVWNELRAVCLLYTSRCV